MGILQSQLALYGAIDQAVVDQPTDAHIQSTVEDFLPNTSGFGQRGWYREVRRFLQSRSTRPVTFPSAEEARNRLATGADDGGPLPAAVAARSLHAGVVLDNISPEHADGAGGHRNLADLLSAAPGQATIEIDSQPGRVPSQDAEILAEGLQGVSTQAGFREFMDSPAADPLNSAVRTHLPHAYLRKVRGEYCSVISTTATWDDITFQQLLDVVDPVYWQTYYHEFFCAMAEQGKDDQGWTRILETVSGECGEYSMTTPLKFWKSHDTTSLMLNYDLREQDAADGDRLVLVDNGYIAVKQRDPADPNSGVIVETSKELLIRGLSSAATTALAGSLGWADNASDMFRKGAKTPPAGATAFTNSVLVPPAAAPTSDPFPIDPPVLPADLRAEGMKDSVGEVNGTIDGIATLAKDFASRWQNGIDDKDIKDLGTEFGNLLTDRALSLFTTVASNFRPAPPKT
jgi:hypothetical protein